MVICICFCRGSFWTRNEGRLSRFCIIFSYFVFVFYLFWTREIGFLVVSGSDRSVFGNFVTAGMTSVCGTFFDVGVRVRGDTPFRPTPRNGPALILGVGGGGPTVVTSYSLSVLKVTWVVIVPRGGRGTTQLEVGVGSH